MFQFIGKRIHFKHIRRFSSENAYSEIEKSVIIDKVGEVTVIGLNRPTKRNCINHVMAKNINEALENFEADDSSCAAVIYGTGGNFCAGCDLTELTKLNVKNLNKDKIIQLELPLRLIKKPLVAALSGYAVAEGFEIALMCDLRVIEENAVMGVYNRRFGISCANGGIVRLSSIIGLSRALDLILTGRTITAQEAFQWGLANRLVACGTGFKNCLYKVRPVFSKKKKYHLKVPKLGHPKQLIDLGLLFQALGQAIQVAGSLAKFPQKCLLQDRETLYNSAFKQSMEELLEYERKNAIEIFNQESIEGARKFVELGIGKHGKTYDLKEKIIPDWEKE